MNGTRPPQRTGLREALVIARRDLLEFIRDRRTMFITLLLPMATYPCLALSTALGLRAASTEIERQRAPTRISVVVSGPDAPALATRVLDVSRKAPGGARPDWPAAVAIEPLPAADARARLQGGGCDLWVEAEDGAEERLDDAGTVVLPVHVPPGRPPSLRVREQFEAVIRAVADDARARRMARAGLPATVLRPVELKFVDVPGRPVPPPARSITLELVGGVLVMLAVLTMTGAFYPAIDAIAGEKERGTIETLLIAPCSADVIVGGKFLAVFAVTLATLAVNVVSIVATAAVSMRLLPEGITMAVPGQGIVSVGGAMLAFVGLAAVAAATCLAVTTAAKSGKEAQNTLTPVILLVSGLAGTALLPGMRSESWLAAVPFVGHVLVAREAFLAADVAIDSLWPPGGPLLVVLVSSVACSWLLLRATAAVLTDEDILFRGPDTTTRGFARPAPRDLPTVAQGIVPVLTGLAAVWYAQGFAPDDLLWAIPLQQAAIVLAPLALLATWQRVDRRRTFAFAPAGGGGLWRTAACTAGAALVGAGLFVIGAAALLAVRGTAMSDEARLLSEKLLQLMQSRPWWVSWGLMAVLPAVGEELLFRGWVFAAFTGKAPNRGRLAAAIIAQAACFAVVHLLPERMPQTFVLGLVLAVIVVLTGSLLPAIVGHLAHNSMPLVLMAMTGAGTQAAGAAIPARVLAAAAVAVISGGLLIVAGSRRLINASSQIREEPWR